jgi:hypothetical protein
VSAEFGWLHYGWDHDSQSVDELEQLVASHMVAVGDEDSCLLVNNFRGMYYDGFREQSWKPF